MDEIDYIRLSRKLYDLKCDFAYKLDEIKKEFKLTEEDIAITTFKNNFILPVSFVVKIR